MATTKAQHMTARINDVVSAGQAVVRRLTLFRRPNAIPRVRKAATTLRYLPVLCFASGALAQPVVFDKPLGADPAVGVQRCTYYPDLTVRETQTDSPGTGPTYLLPGGAGGKRATCGPGGRKLNTSEQAFVGRKGGFLFFVPTDANGAETFVVLSVKDGSKIYDDVMEPEAFKSASVSGETLRLVYTRGYDGSCSLLTGGGACWATMMKEGKFTKAISERASPVTACQAGYNANGAKDPPTSTSEITYDVDVTIEPGKKAVVNSRGVLGCKAAG